MAAVVLVGAQWGDEGKSKVVDLYTELADVVVRFQPGDPHTPADATATARDETVTTLLPASVQRRGKRAVLGPGVVFDPEQLLAELAQIEAAGTPVEPQDLLVSDAAHLVLPHHRALDAMGSRDGDGSPRPAGSGIGPALEDKVGLRGVRVGDLYRPGALRFKLGRAMRDANARLKASGRAELRSDRVWDELDAWAERLRPYVGNAPKLLDELRRRGKHLLFDGAQGALLDVDHGVYPFVSGGSFVAGGVCAGAGIGPTHVTAVVGVTKAFSSRMGDGPFPTELFGETADVLRLRDPQGAALADRERARRYGWLDLVALRHATRVCGLTGLAVTKLDAPGGLSKVKVCVAYDLDGERTEEMPLDGGEVERCEPVYEELEGWGEPLADVRTLERLPRAARVYLSRVAGFVGLPILLVSVGDARADTIVVQNPFR